MTKRRKALVVAGALVLLAALGLGALVVMFPAERIGRMVTAQAEEALDREVRIESFRVRILPRPAVALEGVAVSRHARPGGTSRAGAPDATADGFEPLLASVDRIDLRPRILPLLRGNVIIDEVVVDGPALLLEIPEGGTLDLPDLESDEEPADRDAEIEIRSIVVRNGSVLYHDANTGVRVSLSGIEHRLGLDAEVVAGEMSRLDLRGTLSVAAIDADLPGTLAAPLRDLRLALDHDAELHPVEDRLDLRRLDLTLQEFPLELIGVVEALSDPAARTVALQARGEGIDVARLVHSLPPELLEGLPTGPNGETFTGTAGRVTLEAEASGRAGNGEVPEITGLLLLDDVALGYEGGDGRSDLIEALSGQVGFSLDAAATDGLTGRLLGEPFELAFDVRDPAEPHGSGGFRGAFDLAEAVRLGLMPDGVDATGTIAVDLTADGSAAEPDRASVNGNVRLTGVELRVPEILRPVVISDARVDFTGGELAARDVRLTAGASDAAIDVEVRDWLALAIAESRAVPAASFSVVSTLLDLDELLEVDPERPTYSQLALAHVGDEPIDGRSASEHAERLELQLPDLGDVAVDGRIRIGRAVMGELAYENVDATVTGRDGDLAVPQATFGMMGGDVELRASLGRAGAQGEEASLRPLEVEYTVTDVPADAFFEAYTLFRGQVSGRLRLTGVASMNLLPNTLPEREGVGATGTISIADGELRNWPVVREAGRRLGVSELADFERFRVRAWSGDYQVVGSRILIEESELEHSDMVARIAGSFGISGDLDLGATLLLPGAWARRIPGAPAAFVAALAADPDGRIPVGATIRGTTTSPDVGLDLSEARGRAAERAREEAEEAVRDRQQEVEAEVRERLRRFLP